MLGNVSESRFLAKNLNTRTNLRAADGVMF